MVIQPKVRGFICTASHPVGCYKNVEQQVDLIKSQPKFDGPKNVLIIGASTGYGLASRIASAFGAGAKTIGVFFEREASGKRTASAGWYNSAAFEQLAHTDGLYAKSINGDAFSNEIKQKTYDLIREDLGQVDLVVYSLASPRRTDPTNGETYVSTLKPVGAAYENKTVDPLRGEVKNIRIEPAQGDDVANTVAVMGGDDWQMWIDGLKQEGLLADSAITMAYSYIGPELTHPIYKNGTIGHAKDHLQTTADKLNEQLSTTGGAAFISVNKALVTQASSAIPVVPLYISILFKVMKEKGVHEGCIEQMYRLMHDKIYSAKGLITDEKGRVRVDDYEMKNDVQQKVANLWPQVNTENLAILTDIQGYRDEFYRLFGFGVDEVDYEADVDVEVKVPSIETVTNEA